MKTGRKFWTTVGIFATSTALLWQGHIESAIWADVSKFILMIFAPSNIAEHVVTKWGTPWGNKAK